MIIFTLKFWKKLWIWLKVNWKFLLGLAIPIVISVILRKKNTISILKKASESKQQHFETEMKAAGLEADLKNAAHQQHAESLKKINLEPVSYTHLTLPTILLV